MDVQVEKQLSRERSIPRSVYLAPQGTRCFDSPHRPLRVGKLDRSVLNRATKNVIRGCTSMGQTMGRFYFICERLRSGRGKFLSVLNGREIALKKLKFYAGETSNEVYVLDVLSGKVIARRNA
jgi:hypothetical protein